MNSKNSNNVIFSSLIWKFLERGGSQGIQFIVQIILARLLSPSEFGAMAIVLVFISLAQTFVDGGFSTALIQKKDADKLDFSSIFYLSLGIASIVYILILIFAPIISNFYQSKSLTPILRVLSLILFPGALNSIQVAYVARNMQFKKLFKTSLIATVISAIVSISAAYLNFGIWALVIQQITYHIVNSIALWFSVRWRPELIFSIKRVEALFSYGSKIFISNFIYRIYLDIRTLLIGRIYNATDLAFYQRGEQIPRVLVNNIDGSIQAVILPALSTHQDDQQRIKSIIKRTLSISSYLIFPIMIGVIVVAEPLVIILMKEKWLPAVPFLRIFCLTYAFWPIITINLQPMRALGKSELLLKLEIIKRIIGMLIIIISIPFGIYAIAFGAVLERLIEVFINAHPNKKLINYSISEQIRDISPSLLQSFLMGLVVFLLQYLRIAPLPLLFLQIFVGGSVYILLSVIFKNQSFTYLIISIKNLIFNRN